MGFDDAAQPGKKRMALAHMSRAPPMPVQKDHVGIRAWWRLIAFENCDVPAGWRQR